MNEIESEYLLEHGITLTDWYKVIKLIGQSLYLKISNDYKSAGLTLDQYKKLISKLKKAELVKEINNELRLDPYFYTRNDTPDSVLGKLKNDWDGVCRGDYPDVTDEDGVIFIYDPKLRHYREATVKDLIKRDTK